jgi:hypothetical protein
LPIENAMTGTASDFIKDHPDDMWQDSYQSALGVPGNRRAIWSATQGTADAGERRQPGRGKEETGSWKGHWCNREAPWLIGNRRHGHFARSNARKLAMSDGNMGCPHEEGKDFPHGEDCPFCPFWKGK